MKSKYFLMSFIFVFLFATISTQSVRADFGTIAVGDKWTLTGKLSSTDAATDMEITVKSVSSSSVKADICGEGVTAQTDYEIGDVFVWSQSLVANVLTLGSETTAIYGGRNVTLYYTTALSSYPYIAVEKSTGIVLNITETGGMEVYVSAWTAMDCPMIPGYDIYILLGAMTVGSIGIIYTIMRRSDKNLLNFIISIFFFIFKENDKYISLG